MLGFHRDAQERACFSGTPLRDLLAEAGTGTPAYLYDLDAIEAEARAMIDAFGESRHEVAYAIKANSAASIVRTVVRAGCGAEVVSGGELRLALEAGVPRERVMMTSVAKKDVEIDAALGAGIRAIQLESVEEIPRVAARARALGLVAQVSFRINPGVEVDTNAKVATGHERAKFGIGLDDLGLAWERTDAEPAVTVVGIGAHVGSTLKVVASYLDSAKVVCRMAKARLASGKGLEFIDFGGGFSIDYGAGPLPSPAEFLSAARALAREQGLSALRLVAEPGRSMVAAHGVLVASVVQEKRGQKQKGMWVFIDAAMNDLVRPAMYGARHRIEPLDALPGGAPARVAGPVCESSDDFGEHKLGEVVPGAVVIRDAGAYGYSMASEYNGRPLPAEIFVRGGRVATVSRSPGVDAWVARRLGA